jgi:non-ribosomal peptide synthetase component F
MTIMQTPDHLKTSAEDFVADREQRLSKLPLLTYGERHQVLPEWNQTAVDRDHDESVYRLLERQVKRTPEAIAVACESEQLTYSELNRRANQLARHLRTMGVGQEVMVAMANADKERREATPAIRRIPRV